MVIVSLLPGVCQSHSSFILLSPWLSKDDPRRTFFFGVSERLCFFSILFQFCDFIGTDRRLTGWHFLLTARVYCWYDLDVGGEAVTVCRSHPIGLFIGWKRQKRAMTIFPFLIHFRLPFLWDVLGPVWCFPCYICLCLASEGGEGGGRERNHWSASQCLCLCLGFHLYPQQQAASASSPHPSLTLSLSLSLHLFLSLATCLAPAHT